MSKDQVEWVSLEDVIAAADCGLAPLGPEFAGFVVLEATTRVREMGGTVDASLLAIGSSGHVALTAPPLRGDEREATAKLRALLGQLLAVASSSTPALRHCAKRKEPGTLGALARELEGALIPLNRAASRRGVARVARETLEALDSGRLDVRASASPREESESPAPVVASKRAPVEAKVQVKPEPTPVVEEANVPAPVVAEPSVPPPLVENEADLTPYAAPVFEPSGAPPPALLDAAHEIEEGDPAEIEIVSSLPPIVEPHAHEDSTRGFALARDVDKERSAPRADRVAAMVDRFEVSRRRDDPALARDLQKIAGLDTTKPPSVVVNVKLRARDDEDVEIDHDVPSDVPVQEPPRRSPLRAAFTFFALGAFAAAVATAAARPSTLDALFGAAPSPPVERAAATAAVVSATPNATPKMPAVCEASLSLDGVANGSEVLRRLGAMPLSVALPTHTAIDLVATLDGKAPRRAHVEANAAWQSDATGAHLEVPFTLDAGDPRWPAGNGVVPLRNEGQRGLLHATSSPAGATLWVVVDAKSISGVPCGAPVDLQIVAPGASPKPVHVEWSAFSGAPPRATVKVSP